MHAPSLEASGYTFILSIIRIFNQSVSHCPLVRKIDTPYSEGSFKFHERWPGVAKTSMPEPELHKYTEPRR